VGFPLVKKKTRRPPTKKCGDFFVKHGIENLEKEVEKYNALYEVSLKTDLFKSPEIISFNKPKKSITFEYIDNLTSIREIYLRYMTSDKQEKCDLQLLSKTGAALAKIHLGLSLETSIDWISCPSFDRFFLKKTKLSFNDAMKSVPMSIAHCDYGFSNIHTTITDSGGGDLIIFDPSPNEFISKSTNLRAPILLDLSNLISCVYGLVPFRNYRHMHWSRMPIITNSIVQSYEDVYGTKIDATLLSGMVYATARCYLNSAYRQPFSRIAAWLLFTSLIKRKT
jgi:hypothetical protein